MRDRTLTEDLICPAGTPFALVIDASDVTLDLGGFTIFGNYVSGDFGGGVTAEGVDGITIRNGTLDGFLGAISIFSTDDAVIEDLTISNLATATSDIFVVGIGVIGSHNVVVKDVRFAFPSANHKEGVIIDTSEVSVLNIEMQGGSVGVNFGGSCEVDAAQRSRGSVLDSTFTGLNADGVLLQCTSDALIAGNTFSQNERGIFADFMIPEDIQGLTIDGNRFVDGYIGMRLNGVTGATISNNVVRDNSHHGIALGISSGCAPDIAGFECFVATGNQIIGNDAIGNLFDLWVDEGVAGNTWVENTCVTKEGPEIPACTGTSP